MRDVCSRDAAREREIRGAWLRDGRRSLDDVQSAEQV
jgi:hypothetical protein